MQPAGMALPPPSGNGAQQVTYYVYQMNAPAAGAGGAPVKFDFSTCFTFYFLRAFLCFFLWAAWTILIAGTAQSQKNCNSGLMPQSPFPDALIFRSNGQGAETTADCVYYFALLWWATWLQFVVVLAATATTFQVLSKYRHVKAIFTTTMYFFIMSSVLLFFIADTYNRGTYMLLKKIDNASHNWISSCTLVTVGAVASLVFNFIYIIWNSYTDIPFAPTSTPAPVAVDGDAFVAPEQAKVAHTTHTPAAVPVETA